jgi:hypothetical protein
MRSLPEMKLRVLMDGLSCSAPIQTIRTVPALICTDPNNHSSDVFSLFFIFTLFVTMATPSSLERGCKPQVGRSYMAWLLVITGGRPVIGFQRNVDFGHGDSGHYVAGVCNQATANHTLEQNDSSLIIEI